MGLRVVFFQPDATVVGGVERIVVNRANLFEGVYGYDVTILSCFNGSESIPYPLNNRVKTASLGVKTYPKNPLKKIAWYLGLVKPLSKWLEAERPDIIVAEGGYLCDVLALAKCEGIIKIGCEHVSYYSFSKGHQVLRRLLYPRLNAIVVLTESDREYFSKWSRLVRCIPNFLDSFPPSQAPLRSKQIICVGRLVHQKGFDLLIRATKPVFQRHPAWQLTIFGDGEDRKMLEDLVHETGQGEFISLPGSTDTVFSELLGASIFVMPSRFEGFGMTLLEAMACGLACISFDCPGPDSFLFDHKNGLMVALGDLEGLGEAIVRLIENEEERKELGEAARKDAMGYSAEEVGIRWKGLIELAAQKCTGKK